MEVDSLLKFVNLLISFSILLFNKYIFEGHLNCSKEIFHVLFKGENAFKTSPLIGPNKIFKKNNQCELRSPKKLIFV